MKSWSKIENKIAMPTLMTSTIIVYAVACFLVGQLTFFNSPIDSLTYVTKFIKIFAILKTALSRFDEDTISYDFGYVKLFIL